MADESPELIEKDMEATRQSLAGKVAALEQTVVGSIQDAASTVQETVQSVRTAMHDTVSTVKSTVSDSVETVSQGIKQTFDISHHVRENPWAAVGAAAAAGFVTGLLVFRPKSLYAEGVSSSSGSSHADLPSGSSSHSPAPTYAYRAPEPRESRRPGWVDDLLEMFGQEAKKIGAQAIAALSATAKENIEQGVPKLFEGGLSSLFDKGQAHGSGQPKHSRGTTAGTGYRTGTEPTGGV